MAEADRAERHLIERACRGDRQAQQVLWRRHRRWVAAIVLAHRPRQIDVDDLMQDVAVKFISKVPTLRDPAALQPWLRQIVINVCRGAGRSLRPTLHLVETGEEEPAGKDRAAVPAAPEPGPEADDRRDMAHRLLAQLMTLPPEYREPMLLRCVRSMSYQQISSLLDLPVTTIETRLARARRMLKQELEESDTSSSGRAESR